MKTQKWKSKNKECGITKYHCPWSRRPFKIFGKDFVRVGFEKRCGQEDVESDYSEDWTSFKFAMPINSKGWPIFWNKRCKEKIAILVW